MQAEHKVITAAVGLFCIVLIFALKALPSEPVHDGYCERVALYEQTKHLPERDILGHKNYEGRRCNGY